MNRNLRVAVVFFVMAIAAAISSYFATPRFMLAGRVGVPDLENIVPLEFNSWVMDRSLGYFVVNPVQEEMIDRVYDRVLMRTYIGPNGYRVMLSIAYGADQRSGLGLSVHYPEVCYPAQGFEVRSNKPGAIFTDFGRIPVRRLETFQGTRRSEPVSYWILVGGELTTGGLHRRVIELKYGVNGEVPDGLLFRVSSIDSDNRRAFEMQEMFVRELLEGMPESVRPRLIGLH